MKTTKIFAALCCVVAVFTACEMPNDPNYGQNGSDNGQNSNNDQTQTGNSGTANGHAWVDLGLSVKWATCNVGAAKPEEYGDHYAWGETMPKSVYSSDSYLYFATSDVLSMDKDAARVNWGGKWRMPTDAEWTELREKCKWTWTTRNGVKGCEIKSKTNGNFIFLPAAGRRYYDGLYAAGEYGYYWSSSIDADNKDIALGVYFSIYVDHYNNDRFNGLSVRPVIK